MSSHCTTCSRLLVVLWQSRNKPRIGIQHLWQSKKSIHLSALRKTTGEKGVESGSTYQLADSLRSGDSLTGFDAHASDRHIGVVTSVSPGRGRDTFESDDNMGLGMNSGIMVKNETSFRISTQPAPVI